MCVLRRAGAAAVLAVILLAGLLQAAPPPLLVTESGYYLLTVGDDGMPLTVKIEMVIDLNGGELPDVPDDPGEPDGPEDLPFDAELVGKVQTWAEEIGDPAGAQAIATVYAQVMDAVHAEAVGPGKGLDSLEKATDIAIKEAKSEADWEPFLKHITDLMNEKLQRGVLQERSQVVLFLNSIRHGLLQSADGADSLSLTFGVKVAEKINEVLDATE